MSTAVAPARPSFAAYSRISGVVANLTVLAGLLGFFAYILGAGQPFWGLVRAVLAVAITQVLPGALIWRAVRPRDGWLLEDLAMGFALGIAVAVPAQVVGGLLHSRIPSIALPLLVIAIFVGVPATRRRILSARWSPIPWWLGVTVAGSAFAAFAALVGFSRQNKLFWPFPGTPYVDMYLHQALASQMLTRGPVSWPTVNGEVLGYQWFAHAWMAQVTASSGTPLDQVLLRFMPALLPIVVTASVAAATLRLTGRAGVAAIAAFLTMFGSQATAWGNGSVSLPLTPLSPTLGLGVPTLLAMIAVLAMRWRGEAQSGAFWLIPVLTIIATGTKGSTAPIVIAGLALAIVAMWFFHRSMVLPVLKDLLVIGVFLALTMVLVFHGSAAGLAFGPTAGSKQTVLANLLGGLPSSELQRLAGATAVISGMTRAALGFVLPFHRTTRRDPVTFVLLGATIAGAAAVGIFTHPGASQGYFLVTAEPLAAIASALGAAVLWDRAPRKVVLSLLGLGIVGGFLFFEGPTVVVGPLHKHAYGHPWSMITVAIVLALGVALVGAVLLRRWGAVRAGAVTFALIGLCAGPFSVAKSYEHGFVGAPPKPVKLTKPFAVSQGQLDAAVYIRNNSGVDDLVMTNRHCSTPIVPNHCDNRRWVVTAFTERQSLVEGWTATPRATDLAPHGRDSVFINYWKPEILKLNDGFIAAPTVEARDKLWAMGVRWAYVDTLLPHSDNPNPYATIVFQNKDAVAWKITPPTK